MHGWGANAQDLVSLAPVLNLPECEFLFPDAPFPHPHVPWGRMWYNLEDSYRHGLEESRQALHTWLLSLEKTTGVPLNRTILGGFSQGGAMTLDVGLSLPLAGLVCLSGFLLPLTETEHNSYPPVAIAHGTKDSIVSLELAQQARDTLIALGVSVEYEEFSMGHEIQPTVLDFVRQFILKVMSET